MTTFNGERYLLSQLDSIRNQSLKPDEVIICDDCSSDRTVEIVNNYTDTWNLKGWKLVEGEKNLGWKKNFYKAISLTKGDIVFFCDQDDIWENKKIQTMQSFLNEYEYAEVVCCTTCFIDGEDHKISVSPEALPYGSKNGPLIKKNKFDNKFIYAIMPGCTMAVKRSLIERLYPLLASDEDLMYLPHDALFWKIATIEEKAYICNMDLVRYRIHSSNSSAPQITSSYKVKTKEKRNKEIDANKKEITLIKQICMQLGDEVALEQLDSIISFCNWRKSFLERRELTKVFSYVKYYRSFKMFCGDLLLTIINK